MPQSLAPAASIPVSSREFSCCCGVALELGRCSGVVLPASSPPRPGTPRSRASSSTGQRIYEFPPRRGEPVNPGRDMRCRRRVALGEPGRSVAASQALLPLGSLGRDGDGMALAARPRRCRTGDPARDGQWPRQAGRPAGELGAGARARQYGGRQIRRDPELLRALLWEATGEEPSRQHSCRGKSGVNELEIPSS
jgi:hypothetical protein